MMKSPGCRSRTNAYASGIFKGSHRCLAAMLLLTVFVLGCKSTGTFPHSTSTQVDLTRKNYRVVKPNVVGSSSGFKLLGIVTIVPPRYTAAMSDLYNNAGVEAGTAQALVNVTQEESSVYLLLFSIPKLTVRADIVEFTE